MSSVELTRMGDVWLLTMKGSETKPGIFENRFNPTFVAQLNEALDTVENTSGTTALVTTSTGKIFCNGLDLTWLADNTDQTATFLASFEKLLHRIQFFPVPTVAAINGHAFAGGCMFSIAHDYRVMREDRGFICLNEIDLGMTLTEGMNALVKSKIDPRVLRAMLLQGHRSVPVLTFVIFNFFTFFCSLLLYTRSYLHTTFLVCMVVVIFILRLVVM